MNLDFFGEKRNCKVFGDANRMLEFKKHSEELESKTPSGNISKSWRKSFENGVVIP